MFPERSLSNAQEESLQSSAPFPREYIRSQFYNKLMRIPSEEFDDSDGEHLLIRPILDTVEDALGIIAEFNNTTGNPHLSAAISEDLTAWLESQYQDFISEPETSKLIELDGLVNHGGDRSHEEWQDMIRIANTSYPDRADVWSYYEDKMAELAKLCGDEEDVSILIDAARSALSDHLSDAFSESMESELSKHISLKKDDFLVELKNKMGLLDRLFSTVSFLSGYLGRFWDLSHGVWKDVGLEELIKFAELLESSKDIQELVYELGRLQDSEDQTSLELLEKTEIVSKIKASSIGKSEIVGIHYSDDLNSLLPHEVAKLSDPVTELLFSKDFVEKKLLTLEYVSQSTYETNDSVFEESPVPEEYQGPIIACIDTSGSMHGEPERVAKILLFALLKMALEEGRDCYLISFSTQIKTLDISNVSETLPALISFLRMSFHGGTDATPAFLEAVEMLETESYRKADIIMVSDFIMPDFSEEIKERIIHHREAQGTRFHCLTITDLGNQKNQDVFDNNWSFSTSRQDMVRNMTLIKKQLARFRDP